jgi:hypothetical protein
MTRRFEQTNDRAHASRRPLGKMQCAGGSQIRLSAVAVVGGNVCGNWTLASDGFGVKCNRIVRTSSSVLKRFISADLHVLSNNCNKRIKCKPSANHGGLPSGGSSSSNAWMASNAALSSTSLPTDSIKSGCRDMSSLLNPKPSP